MPSRIPPDSGLEDEKGNNPFSPLGAGCDVCGFGSVEDTDKFDATKPCPQCGTCAKDEHEAMLARLRARRA